MISATKLAAITGAVCALAASVATYKICSLVQDSRDLSAYKLAAATAVKSAADMRAAASAVLAAERTIIERERVIDRGIIKEIQTNETVYRNVCITDSGMLLINSLTDIRAAASTPAALP